MRAMLTDEDRRIIDATSIALSGQIGLDDDVDRLMQQVVDGDGEPDKVRVACEIAVAWIRFAQDLKASVDVLRRI